MLSPVDKERLRTLTVEVLLEIRRAYLQTGQANVLRHWDQLQDRTRSSARMSSSPEEWATNMARSLRLDAPSSRFSEAVLELTHAVREMSCEGAWLDLLEREYQFMIVMARRCAEQRKEEAKNAVRDS